MAASLLDSYVLHISDVCISTKCHTFTHHSSHFDDAMFFCLFQFSLPVLDSALVLLFGSFPVSFFAEVPLNYIVYLDSFMCLVHSLSYSLSSCLYLFLISLLVSRFCIWIFRVAFWPYPCFQASSFVAHFLNKCWSNEKFRVKRSICL